MREYDEFKPEAQRKAHDGQPVASAPRELGSAESLLHRRKRDVLESRAEAEKEVIALRKSLRRTAITRALDQGTSYRQAQMMSGRRGPKTVLRYDYHRENLDLSAANFLSYSLPDEAD
jgi:hypothetical protein